MIKRFRSMITSAALILLASLCLPTPASGTASLIHGYAEGQSAQAAADIVGGVFALTNRAEENEVVIFDRADDGRLQEAGRASTGGNGTGSPLDSQGALILNANNTRLYACNAGSDEISVFAVLSNNSLRLMQKVRSGGDLPLSLTIHDDLLYVLNAGSGSNIVGFTVNANGTLKPLAGSFRRLSTFVGVPAQIQFNPQGNVLVVTHKATDVLTPPQNIIDTFRVGANGLPGQLMANPSNGIRPFGFAFRSDGVMVVSESFNVKPGESAASSYNVLPSGQIQLVSGSVKNMQTDVCWIVITNDGRFAYATNFISGTISSYTIGNDGSLTLLNAVAARTGNTSQPEDMDLSVDGRYLYALLTGVGQVVAYRIDMVNGRLVLLHRVGGIPAMAGATGLAAY